MEIGLTEYYEQMSMKKEEPQQFTSDEEVAHIAIEDRKPISEKEI